MNKDQEDGKPSMVFKREVVSAAKGRVKTRIMSADGVVSENPWQNNLILDSGLDKVAYMPWACTFQWCVSGTGTTPTKVTTDSTASQSGSTVTINQGSFQFTPAHVGKLIYWPDSNVESRITGFNDSQQVTVNVSRSTPDSSFVIYNVDQTALTTPHSMHARYQTGEGFCGTVYMDNVVKLTRTFDFYMELSPVFITEIGFKEAPAVTTLFSRILLENPLYLSAGQWLQVSYELTLRLEPKTLTTRTPTITGWSNTTGKELIQLYGIGIIDTNGIVHPRDGGHLANEPYAPGSQFLGPGYGYVNRWANGEASPIKIYSKFTENPFINPRDGAANYAASSSKNYLPNLIGGNAQWPSNSSSSGQINTLANARIDCMRPLNPPPLYPSPPSTAGAWNGTDPYSQFPNAVPVYGNGPTWENWMDEISPDTVEPTTIQLNVSGSNLNATSYEWAKWNGLSYDVIVGANGTSYSVQATDTSPKTETRIMVTAKNGDEPVLSREFSLYSQDDTSSPETYTILFKRQPFIRKVHPPWVGFPGWFAHKDDIGPGSNSTIAIEVYRNLVKLTPTNGSPKTGQYRLGVSNPEWETDGETVFLKKVGNTLVNDGYQTGYSFNSSSDRLSVGVYVDIEGVVIGNLSSLEGNRIQFNAGTQYAHDTYPNLFRVPLIQPDGALPRMSVSSGETSMFKFGTGVVDVCGSSVFISENGSAPATIGTSVDRSVPRSVEIPLFLEPYTPKSFTRVKRATFLTNFANGTNWRTIGIGGLDPNVTVASRFNAAKFNTYAFVFDEAQTKLNTHELHVFFRWTWRRDFT